MYTAKLSHVDWFGNKRLRNLLADASHKIHTIERSSFAYTSTRLEPGGATGAAWVDEPGTVVGAGADGPGATWALAVDGAAVP